MIVFLFILLILFILCILIYRHYLPAVKAYNGKQKKYALLLGCPSRNDGSLSRSQKKRCQLAADAWQKQAYQTLVISGGAVKNQYVESKEMAKVIQKVCPAQILCETKARNTFENFKFAKEIIGDDPVLILSSDLHARRSCAIAAQFFSDYQVLTYPDHKPKHILREIISRFIYIKIEIKKAWQK